MHNTCLTEATQKGIIRVRMKEYYYLDINRKVCGPHKLDELAGMLKAGTVMPDTEVASPGDGSWVPLGSLVTQEQLTEAKLPPIPAMLGAPGKCPSCKTALETEAAVLPARCPQCGRVLRSAKGGGWGNLVLPLRLYATFSGRATRAEYWIFTLVVSVLMYALLIGGMAMSFVGLAGGSLEQLKWGVTIALGGVFIMALLCIVPLLSVQVRRLHDVGWSGWWLGAAWLCNLVYTVGLYVVCREEYAKLSLAVEQSVKQGNKNMLQAVQLAMDTPVSPMLSAFCMLNLVSQVLFLLIFVLSFFDSRKGPNKYGPSSKYPMG